MTKNPMQLAIEVLDWVQYELSGTQYTVMYHKARAALDALNVANHTHVLAPRNPSDAMLDVVDGAIDEFYNGNKMDCVRECGGHVYKAMLAAAQKEG